MVHSSNRVHRTLSVSTMQTFISYRRESNCSFSCIKYPCIDNCRYHWRYSSANLLRGHNNEKLRHRERANIFPLTVIMISLTFRFINKTFSITCTNIGNAIRYSYRYKFPSILSRLFSVKYGTSLIRNWYYFPFPARGNCYTELSNCYRKCSTMYSYALFSFRFITANTVIMRSFGNKTFLQLLLFHG